MELTDFYGVETVPDPDSYTEPYDPEAPPEVDDLLWDLRLRHSAPRQSAVWVWLRMVPDDDADLGLEECADSQVGDRPEWLDHMVSEDGWRSILRISYPETLEEWALAEGVAPWQPFLVEVTQPVSSQSYEGEWDCDWSWGMLHVLPLDPGRAADRWAEWLHDNHVAMCRANDAARVHDRMVLEHVDGMELSTDRYSSKEDPPGGYGPYDNWERNQTGIRVTLRSYTFSRFLAAGQDDKGRFDVALRALLRAARRVLPGVDPSLIKVLPCRR